MSKDAGLIPMSAGGTKVRCMEVIQCRNLIYDTLVRSGKLNLVKCHLSDLLRFSGWNAMIRDKCTQYFKKEGIENVNFSHMLCDIIPFAREQVPQDIRDSVKEILFSIARAQLTAEDFRLLEKEGTEAISETYLPYEYQSRNKVPDYGDPAIFNQLPDINILSPAELRSPAPNSPAISINDPTSTISSNSPNNLVREMGGIVLLDRVDPEKENERLEKEKIDKEKDSKDRERHDRERLRQEIEKDRAERLEKERQERKEREMLERERSEQKDRDRPEPQKDRRERHNHPQSLSVPSSPSTPRQEKKSSNLTEAAVMMKLGQAKQAPPPRLASTLITATAAITGKKSKHIHLNISDDDDEDDEELMDI